jgi:hypothetical protein
MPALHNNDFKDVKQRHGRHECHEEHAAVAIYQKSSKPTFILKCFFFVKYLLENLIVTHLMKNIPTFIEPEASLLFSKVPATGLQPILSVYDNSVHTLTHFFFMNHFNITLSSTPGFPKSSIPYRFLD